MERKALLAVLRALDLRITSKGMAERGGLQYMFVGGTDVQLPDGTVVPIDLITEASVSEMDGTLTLSTETEAYVTGGGRMSASDVTVPSARPMPKTTAELNDVFAELYPDYQEQLYYDVLNERDMVDMAMLDYPEKGVVPLDDKIVAVYHEHIERRLKQAGFQGTLPTRQVMDEVLTIQTYNRPHNAFREWFESHEWDGVPRVRAWFQDVFGATAPALTPEEELQYLGDVAEAWFVGAVSRQYITTHHEVVPVLIGDQGIGKGLGLRYTAGNNKWFIDTNADVHETSKFLEGIRGRIVVELSESTQLRTQDMELLKGFISKDEDQIRKPYNRFPENCPRHFVLIATANVDNIFTDLTGNRRFFPMYCEPSRATRKFSLDRTIGQYDVEQVWAEALHMFRNGGRYYVPKSTTPIARRMQLFCTVESPNVSSISDWLDSHIEYRHIGARVSRRTIFEEYFGVDENGMGTRDMESAYRKWAISDKAWKKVASLRVNGKVTRGYERVLLPEDAGKSESLLIVDDESPSEAEMPVDVMREIITRYGCRNFGDPFPVEGLDPDIVSALQEEGYIYESHLGEYRVGALP